MYCAKTLFVHTEGPLSRCVDGSAERYHQVPIKLMTQETGQ